jgi:hypothetical protein
MENSGYFNFNWFFHFSLNKLLKKSFCKRVSTGGYFQIMKISWKNGNLFFSFSNSNPRNCLKTCVFMYEIDVLNELLHNSLSVKKYELGLFHQGCLCSTTDQCLCNKIFFWFLSEFLVTKRYVRDTMRGSRRIQGVRALLRVPRNACYTRGRRTRRGQGYTEGAAKSLP